MDARSGQTQQSEYASVGSRFCSKCHVPCFAEALGWWLPQVLKMDAEPEAARITR